MTPLQPAPLLASAEPHDGPSGFGAGQEFSPGLMGNFGGDRREQFNPLVMLGVHGQKPMTRETNTPKLPLDV